MVPGSRGYSSGGLSCLLFVYGTLQRGQRAHELLSGAERIGTAHTDTGYELRDLGRYPALVATDDPVRVEGELYRVERALLVLLDRYEGHPQLFRRTPILLSPGTRALTYIYAGGDAEHYPRIEGGRWPPPA